MPSSQWTQDEAKWEEAKATIRRLYLDEEMTLKDVARVMRKDFSLMATPDMYKRRLASWGIQKNVKRRDALAMVRIARFRAATDGKETAFRLRNSKVDPANIDRYLKRKYHSNAEVIKEVENIPLDLECLEYATPPNVPLSPRLSASSALSLELLTHIKDYFRSSFDGTLWVRQTDNLDCHSTRPRGGDMNGLKEMFSSHDLACQLLDSKRPQEAGAILRNAFTNIQGLISAQHPRMLTAVFDLTVHLIRKKRPEVAMILLKQFSRLASVILGDTHPVGQIFLRLLEYRSFDFNACLLMAWQNAIDQLENHLGALHYSTIRCRLEYIQMAIGLDDLTLAERKICQLLDSCEADLGHEDLRTLKLQETLADTMLELRRWQDSNVVGQKLVRGAQIFLLEDYERFVDLTCSGLFIVARSHHGQGLQDEAVLALTDAIEFCACHRGLQHPLSIKYLVTMEDWARESSNVDLLTAVHVRRMEALVGLTRKVYLGELSSWRWGGAEIEPDRRIPRSSNTAACRPKQVPKRWCSCRH